MPRLEIDFLTDYDDASLLAELQRIAKVTGIDTVTKKDLKRVGRVSHSAIVRHFGSLRDRSAAHFISQVSKARAS